ncbi:aliphatic sulfonates family ABC transporter, periplasmic ligand-binding protein [Burkholderia thailandensis E444]|nr:aliphatic sulfonates family ABC transporter, periplasmic ligand-binding protein [Burkholderia thailandensis E444]
MTASARFEYRPGRECGKARRNRAHRISARQCAAAREDRLPRHRARLSRPRRCARGIRAARRRYRGRCQGNWGSLSCRDRASGERTRDRKRQRAREQHAVPSREPEVRRSRAAARARAARRSRRGRSLAREYLNGRRATLAARRSRYDNARARVEACKLRRVTDRRRGARVSAADRRYVLDSQADSAHDRCHRPRAGERHRQALASQSRRAKRRRLDRLIRRPSNSRSRHDRRNGFADVP